jgi:hypothetical protein
MPISAAAQTLGVPPALNGRTGWQVIQDFNIGDNANLYPPEASGASTFTFDTSGTYANASRMGVVVASTAGADPALGTSDSISFFLNDFATASFQWLWFLSALSGAGANQSTYGMGLAAASSNWSACGGGQQVGFAFSSDWVTTCGGALGRTNNVINCVTRDAVGVFVAGTGPNLSTLVGQWNTCRLDWARSTGTITWTLNGSVLASNNTRIPAVVMNVFSIGTAFSGVNPADTIAFDYWAMRCTMNR